jgi:hypothetical protein
LSSGNGRFRSLATVCPSPDPVAIPSHRLLDTVATTADLAAVKDLVGWSNDRLVADRIARLPQTEWVYGVASIVMAAFLHVAPGGMRFNGPELGAWYAADDIRTAAAEVAHHFRRETVARNVTTMTRTYRAYTAALLGDYLDLRGQQTRRPDVYASDRYDRSKLGEEVRARGGAGLLYDSLRRRTGSNLIAHRPRNIADIVQTDHFEITVLATSRTIDIRKLSL